MTRVPIVAGNWKMNTTVAEAVALVEAMLPHLKSESGVEVVLCPPFVSLAPLAQLLSGTGVLLGAQNAYFEARGPFTGEVSPTMLQGLASYVIVGHSERRQFFGESDEVVARKLKAAMIHGLRPILCVGEKLEEREAGSTSQVVQRQIITALRGLDNLDGLVVAYEPVWAIGTGRPARGIDANAVMGEIRRLVEGILGVAKAARLRIQYGGSVTAENFWEFITQPEVDGALVGGASLNADSFVSIVHQAGQAKGHGLPA